MVCLLSRGRDGGPTPPPRGRSTGPIHPFSVRVPLVRVQRTQSQYVLYLYIYIIYIFLPHLKGFRRRPSRGGRLPPSPLICFA